MIKKGYKEVDAQITKFFYASVILFNVTKNIAFAKM